MPVGSAVARYFPSVPDDLLHWLRTTCEAYEFDAVAVLRRADGLTGPFAADDFDQLETTLAEGGHLLPLPKEPATLANIIEITVGDHVLDGLDVLDDAAGLRGTERGYPDIEIAGALFGGSFHAVDVKVARRNSTETRTQSRITLYTGNTYFR